MKHVGRGILHPMTTDEIQLHGIVQSFPSLMSDSGLAWLIIIIIYSEDDGNARAVHSLVADFGLGRATKKKKKKKKLRPTEHDTYHHPLNMHSAVTEALSEHKK